VLSAIGHIQARRSALRQAIDIDAHFQQWEESCVPSYCHRNPLAAYVSWWRLFAAARLARKHCPDARRALDFGASVGELGRLLGPRVAYEYVEAHEDAAAFLQAQLPQARRRSLEALVPGAYDWIFAIDALEHNEDYAGLLDRLATALSPRGVLVLSGPTENRLYRFGRRIAGFDGHYHTTTIFHIEAAAAQRLRRRDLVTIVPGLRLFRLTAWSSASAPDSARPRLIAAA
jgi:2-polyprenyl-3-methyl-5-hydroxy-6-metoxy-1,4-benzoquinol methylase